MYEAPALTPLTTLLAFIGLAAGYAVGGAARWAVTSRRRSATAEYAGAMLQWLLAGFGTGVMLSALGPVATVAGAILGASGYFAIVLMQKIGTPREAPYSPDFIRSRIRRAPRLDEVVQALSLRPAPSHISPAD